MILILLTTLLCVSSVFGGSACPPREDIYPCTCANVAQSKGKFATIVTCRLLQDSDQLGEIFPFLRAMRIDQFYLYDSFWDANLLGEAGEMKMVLPSDWLTLLMIKEMEIVDTTLSPCFACQWRLNCRNGVTTSFKVFNSSSTEKICTLCDSGRDTKYPWTGCMSKLKKFSFNHGKLTTLGTDLFPMALRELTQVNLSYNQIVKVDPNSLKNLPELTSLDLSHNAIQYIDHIFGGQVTKLEYLDVSWNFIKEVGDKLITSLPVLKTFKADNNEIVNFKESDWTSLPESLRHIDLSNNLIHCDCNVRWVNGSFSNKVVLLGTCSTPAEYSTSPYRRASRYMIERCDEAGVVGTRPPTSKKPKTSSTTPQPRRSTSYRRIRD